MNTVSNYFRYFFYVLRAYLRYVYIHLSGVVLPIRVNQIANTENEYIKKRTNEFKKVFDSSKCNENINPIFYNKSAYDEYMNQENESKMEQQWKLRILLEFTPRGNVSMYYDPYKMGFKYYSDQKTISYELLNACAMKYVKFFQCRDFFMDEYHLTDKNPLIKIHYNIEASLKKTKNKTNIDGPFIKRNVSTPASTSLIVKEPEPEKNKNKFLYVGKLSNTTFLNIPKKNTKKIMFRSALLEGIEENAQVQDQRLSYKDFKKLSLTEVSKSPEVSTIE